MLWLKGKVAVGAGGAPGRGGAAALRMAEESAAVRGADGGGTTGPSALDVPPNIAR